MNLLREYEIVGAETALKPGILKLLQENGLPVSDLDETKTLIACLSHGEVVGTGGLEIFKDCALLRSISVRKDLQKKGLGKFMVGGLEKMAGQKGVRCFYLLTTTAKDFFRKEGYEAIDRADVPPEIKNTTEFSFTCPSTATAMRKFLS